MKRGAAAAKDRTFSFRAGVRAASTTLAFDARGAAGDLVFLSHASLDDSHAEGPRARAGRQQILATLPTLALLGRTGEALRPRALVAAYGRPFALGDLRLELFPSGVMPGSASLLIERDGRRFVYAGPTRVGTPGFGATAAEARPAHALCLDATYGDPRFVFPSGDEARAEVVAFCEHALSAGRVPVLFLSSAVTTLDVANALAHTGIAARAHRRFVQAATLYRAAGVPAPALLRFAGKVEERAALLWPVDERAAAHVRGLARASAAFVSGHALDPDARAAVEADAFIAMAHVSDHAGLLRTIESTGASEIAVTGARGEAFAAELRTRGHDAYALAPPRQMTLWRR